jgi:hypothetical protein
MQPGGQRFKPMPSEFTLGLAFVRMAMARHGSNLTASWWGTQSSQTIKSTSVSLRLEIPKVELVAEP